MIATTPMSNCSLAVLTLFSVAYFPTSLRGQLVDACITVKCHILIVLYRDRYRLRHAVDRSHRTPGETTRPECPHDRRADRQHVEGSRTPEHCSTCHFKIDRRTGA